MWMENVKFVQRMAVNIRREKKKEKRAKKVKNEMYTFLYSVYCNIGFRTKIQ